MFSSKIDVGNFWWDLSLLNKLVNYDELRRLILIGSKYNKLWAVILSQAISDGTSRLDLSKLVDQLEGIEHFY